MQLSAEGITTGDKPPLQWNEMPECGRCNAGALRRAMRRVSMIYDSYIAQCGLKITQRSILGVKKAKELRAVLNGIGRMKF